MTLTRRSVLIGYTTTAALLAAAIGPASAPQQNAATSVPTIALVSTVTAADTSYKDVTFDDIKLELEKDQKFDKDKHLTEKVEKLEGQKIRIRGWIHPSVFTQTGITQFVLVRDNQECCFGPGASDRGRRGLQAARDPRRSQGSPAGYLCNEGGEREVV